MTKYYLSDNLFVLNNRTYYKDKDKDKDKNKIIKVNNKNWYKYLKNLGWERLDIGWRKRLKEPNKSCFGVIDCGSNGDCLFHVLSDALNTQYLYNGEIPKYDYINLREIASKQITISNFNNILSNYKIEVEVDEFYGDWNPFEINSIEELQNEIKKTGDNFWGDHILLQLLQKALNLNVIILNSENTNEKKIENKFKVHPLASLDLKNNNYTIIIYFKDNCHFQLIGYYDGNLMKTLFKLNEIPNIVLDIYNKDCNIN